MNIIFKIPYDSIHRQSFYKKNGSIRNPKETCAIDKNICERYTVGFK